MRGFGSTFLILSLFLMQSMLGCKGTQFTASPHREVAPAEPEPAKPGEGGSGGDEDGTRKDDKPNKPEEKTPPPDEETPGKSGFHNCLSYDKNKTPIRVDVYKVPDQYKTDWQGIVNSACGQDGLYEDCYDPWRAMKVVEWHQNTTYQAANKLTQFCMTRYDVAQRKFNEGFPKNDGSSEKVARDEWFAFDSWVYLKTTMAGQYQFSIVSDDGSRLRINNQDVIDYDGAHETSALDDPKTPIGNINLPAGKHQLLLRYFQGPRDIIALQLYWKTPQDPTWKIVPTEAFEYWEK